MLLKDISLRLEAGTLTAFAGVASGSGKTPCCEMVNGLWTTSGSSGVGESVGVAKLIELRRDRILIQESGFLPTLTVERNSAWRWNWLDVDKAEIRARVAEVSFALAGIDSKEFSGSLSMQFERRAEQASWVWLGLAPMGAPVLLMDEPFGALRSVTRADADHVEKLLQAFKRQCFL